MAACDKTCNPTGCGGTDNSVILLKKLQSMISDNYTMIFILILILAIVGFSLMYFLNSLRQTLVVWWKNKNENDKTISSGTSGDNPRTATDDDVTYYENSQDDPEFSTDVFKYAPKEQQDFDRNIQTTFKTYNDNKAAYIASEFTGRTNDDIIDRSVMYKEYDNYTY